MSKLKRNDTVSVIRGDYRGKSGKILKMLPREGMAIVEGVAFIKRHMRGSQKNPKGGIVEKEAPISLAKLMLQCPKCGNLVKASNKLIRGEDSTKSDKARVCRDCGEII